MRLRARAAAVVLACASTATVVAPPAMPEARNPRTSRLADKKQSAVELRGGEPASDTDGAMPLLATLDQVHTGEHLVLDAQSPTQKRFDDLLADRSTGSRHPLDPRLLLLLRALASEHQGARIELVSGYRSPKLNEMLRKTGHHVSSHSQHSLGHACDFRIVPPGADKALDPRVVQVEIRRLGWDGGVGVYPTSHDWFVHADVGPHRHWVN